MKTFRLCSLVILLDNEIEATEISIVEGLIINKEEVKKNWLIEAVVGPEMEEYFHKLYKTQEKFMVESTITKTNDPATFVCTVKSVTKLNANISVLLDGYLVVKEEDFSDMILKSIIKEGFEGDEILTEFKKAKKRMW
ncbi:hypothetical protein KHA80_20890 [Anaerobacillus sp. HL2]|nr:hypothetical protein KHA80_20890 [Anaerobacillus sp. HL2]